VRDYATAVSSAARAVMVRSVMLAIGALPFISWSLSGTAAGRVLEHWFRFQCHGRVERSVAMAGRMLPVCSRCLGIYVGLTVAAVVARPRLSSRARRVWLVGAAGLMVTEVLVQDLTGHAPLHALRLLTGLLLAYRVALTVIDAAQATRSGPSASQAAR